MSPCTKKLSEYKSKHFMRYALLDATNRPYPAQQIHFPYRCDSLNDPPYRAKPQFLFAKMEGYKTAGAGKSDVGSDVEGKL